MRSLRLYVLMAAALAATSLLIPRSISSRAPSNTQGSATNREEAYRANNLGVALLEQFKFKEGADQFRRALQLDPRLAIAQTNLAIALYYVPDAAASLREAKTAATVSPDSPQPYFILGLIAKTENRTDEAIQFFQRVLKIDSRDVAANFYLGQLYSQQRKFADAIPIFRTAVDAEPYNSSAVYGLYTALIRTSQREEGDKLGERFKALREGGYGTSFGNNYLEQGRYAEAIASAGTEPGLVDTGTPDVRFTDQTVGSSPAGAERTAAPTAVPIFGRRITASELNDEMKKALSASFGGGVALLDYDGDGDLDLVEVTGAAQRLYRNDGGKFVEVTAQSGSLGTPGSGIATGVVVGDYDNDTRPDIFVLRYGSSTLYHNDGSGKFSDVTAAAGIPSYTFLAVSAAFVDVDHDGDLDIFIAGLVDLGGKPGGSPQLVFPSDFAGAPNQLLRNNGNGKFSDITAEAKVGGSRARGIAVIPTDYDNRRDIDLLVVNYNAAPTLFRNMRDGSFSDVASQVGLTAGPFTSAAAGDFNKDGFMDFYLGSAGSAGVLAVSDGRGSYAIQ
ncbi:MAG TPA: FG-GAP-like repeat-containing protein, partial [Blastocatellia bacterium]|nr:FG-GAP-like repeat-containing protein [Blastocatellia bacterium]